MFYIRVCIYNYAVSVIAINVCKFTTQYARLSFI